MALHHNIKDARRSLRMKQKVLAKRIGVAASTVCLYESGERVPSLEVLIHISATLGVSLDALLAEELKQARIQPGESPAQPRRNV